jgi:uncharacterized membrane protein YheB (UPF0754 family)
MLFRPLRPWYLFGCKLPLTPGLIPARRHDLARNIGEMVGNHLLTSKDIGSAISEEPFQEHLARLVDRKVGAIFKQDLGPLPEIVPERFKPYFQIGVKTLKYRVGEGVNGYLASARFEQQLITSILSRLGDLADQELNRVLSAENRQSLYLVLQEVLHDLLRSDQAEAWLGRYLSDRLRRSAAQGRTLADLLPEQLMATGLTENMDALLDTELSDLLDGVDEDQLGVVCRACARRLLAVFKSEEAMAGLSALLHVGMEEVLDSGQRSLGALAELVFPGEKGLENREVLVVECIALFRSSKTERLVNAMVSSMVDVLLTQPIGKLSDIVPHGVRQGITEYIVLTANRMLLQEVPGVVESLNIKRVVTAKTDALDPLQLERLLLSVMEKRFKYIHLFGALLGFLLGMSNLALVKLVAVY